MTTFGAHGSAGNGVAGLERLIGAGRDQGPHASRPSNAIALAALVAELTDLRESLSSCGPLGAIHTRGDAIDSADVSSSLINIGHYLQVRRRDLRATQELLTEWGVCGLGGAESHVLVTVEAALQALRAMAGLGDGAVGASRSEGPAPSPRDAQRILDARACAVLGPAPRSHRTRLMVTVPSGAASDVRLLEGLVGARMSVARIDTTRGGPEAWMAMVANLRTAGARAGVELRVVADVADEPVRHGSPSTTGEAALLRLAPFVDAIAVRVVRSATEVIDVRRRLDLLGRSHMPLIARIETAEAFCHLPAVVSAGVATGPFAVSIGRSTLALDVGVERFAAVQEEILRLCAAAHVPTVCAGEVLGSLVHTGRPSAVELVDAAHAARSQAALLDGGDNVVEALALLDGILARTASHGPGHGIRGVMRRLGTWTDTLDLSPVL